MFTTLVGIVSKEVMQGLVIDIIAATNLANGTAKFTEESPLGGVLIQLGFLPEVYVCISPKLKLTRHGYPVGHREVEVDLRHFKVGLPKCDHRYINLYWEVGGGGMDSGTPNNYRVCMFCGHHEAKAPLLGRLFSWLAT